MKVEMKPIASLQPYPRNAKIHPEKQVRQIATSIKEFGFNQPIVIDKEGVVVVGHGRLEAAKELGLAEVPVLEVDLTDEQARAYRLADNKLNESEWDVDLLREGLAELDKDLLVDIGFREKELDGLLDLGADTTEDEVPGVRPDPKIKLGDLWQLGEHRLLCGDATKPKDVERLMGGEKADMVFTDPPYAIFGSSTGVGTDIADDKMVRPFFRDVLAASSASVKSFGHVYICCDWRSWAAWWEMTKDVDLSPKNLIVWDKGGGVGSMYTNCYELVGFFAKQPRSSAVGKKETGHRLIRQHASNIMRINRTVMAEREGHNASKPIELVCNIIENSSDKNESVLDLFGGSGTTLIAAERLGRSCRMMEVDTRWVRVIIDRWEKETGKEAILAEGVHE